MKIQKISLEGRKYGIRRRVTGLFVFEQGIKRLDQLVWDEKEFRKALASIGIFPAVCGGAALDCGVPFKVVASTSTPATIVGIKTPANQAAQIYGFNMGFDGTTSTNGPAICEAGTCTFATNSPGTNSTSVTAVAYDSGRPETPQSTGGKAWTAEPTVISVVEDFLIPSYMGSGIVFYPLAHPFVAKGGNGMVIRVTQQSGVSVNGTGALRFSE